MRWIRRLGVGTSSAVEPAGPPVVAADDDPAETMKALALLDRYVNQSSGRLPTAAVVTARWITDTLREIVETSEVRTLDVQAMLTVNGITRDYLPTTLRTFLLLDDDPDRAI